MRWSDIEPWLYGSVAVVIGIAWLTDLCRSIGQWWLGRLPLSSIVWAKEAEEPVIPQSRRWSLIVGLIQAAIFVGVGGWLTANGQQNGGYAPGVFAACAAYAATVYPLRFFAWLRAKKATQRPQSGSGGGSLRRSEGHAWGRHHPG